MSKKSLDNALELMSLVSEQFGGFRIDLANGDSMKIADVMEQVGELLSEYGDDLDHFRRRAENAELAGAQAIAGRAKDLADMTSIILDIATGKKPGKAPGLDLVDVVRCKDCEFRGDVMVCPMRHFGGHIEDYTGDGAFCNRGKRKEEQ